MSSLKDVNITIKGLILLNLKKNSLKQLKDGIDVKEGGF
jgi:hypothetical protein